MSDRRLHGWGAAISALGAGVYGYGWLVEGRVVMGACAALFAGLTLIYAGLAWGER